MDSYRAEAYGLLSLVVYIWRMVTFHEGNHHTDVRSFCDNQSLVERLNKLKNRKRPMFPNDTLGSSWDVIQAIESHLQKLTNWSLTHVKGHQDQGDGQQMLSLEAKLNIRADKLAEEFQSQSDHKHQRVPMIQGTAIAVHVNGKTIHSKVGKFVSKVVGKTMLASRLKRKMREHNAELTDADFDQIDWEGHRLAIHGHREHSTFITKFIHGQLPVGKRVHLYNQVDYNHQCPSCHEDQEDTLHMLRCRHPDRVAWQQTLMTALREHAAKTDTAEILLDLMMEGLSAWFADTPLHFTRHNGAADVQRIIDHQEAIGWEQLLFGRWSSFWHSKQNSYIHNMGINHKRKNHGSSWTSGFIKVIWKHCHEQWKFRNQVLHGIDAETRLAARLVVCKRRLVSMYELKDKCFPNEQIGWFHSTADEHVQKEPRLYQQECWLSTFTPMILRRSREFHDRRNRQQSTMERWVRRIRVPRSRAQIIASRQAADPLPPGEPPPPASRVRQQRQLVLTEMMATNVTRRQTIGRNPARPESASVSEHRQRQLILTELMTTHLTRRQTNGRNPARLEGASSRGVFRTP
jgi:hypothetical protein